MYIQEGVKLKEPKKMNMKLWNFLERVSGIENAVVYIENRNYEQDHDDGAEYHFLEINVEDADSETMEATYQLEAESLEMLEKEKDFIISEYFQGENVIDIIDQS